MPIMDESDVSLPKATLSKMIRELMPPELRFGSESLDMLIECCTEFVNLLSTESNEVSTKEKKNTIHPEHVLQALEDLGFNEFVPEVREAWNSWKEESKTKACRDGCVSAMRPKGHKTAADAAGISEEEQIAMQQSLFAEAKARSNSYQEPQLNTAASLEDHLPATDTAVSASELPAQIDFSDGAMTCAEHIPSSIFADLAARSDVLPLCSLPPSPIASEFTPSVINSTHGMEIEQSDTIDASATSANNKIVMSSPPLDFRNIAMNQPVIVLHEGVPQVVPWRMLIAQLTTPPQSGAAVDSSLQMPTASAHPQHFLQPSFPEMIHSPSAATHGISQLYTDPTLSPESLPRNSRQEMDIQTSVGHD